MDMFQKLNAKCIASLLLVFAHITKRLLQVRSRFSRRIGLGFLSLFLLVCATTPTVYAQSVLSDTLVNLTELPVMQAMDQDVFLNTESINMALTNAVEKHGAIRSIIMVFELDGDIDPMVQFQAFESERSSTVHDMLYETRIRGSLLWVKCFRKGLQPIAASTVIRVSVNHNVKHLWTKQMLLLGGIVIVDNINGLCSPAIGPIKDVLDAETWNQYYEGSQNENPEIHDPIELSPNPIEALGVLKNIPASTSLVEIRNDQFTLISSYDVRGKDWLFMDLGSLPNGHYNLVIFTKEGLRNIQFYKI